MNGVKSEWDQILFELAGGGGGGGGVESATLKLAGFLLPLIIYKYFTNLGVDRVNENGHPSLRTSQ